jgi:predicted RNA-binding Zn-ribbon protein involved in translation (DUF1610 family)
MNRQIILRDGTVLIADKPCPRCKKNKCFEQDVYNSLSRHDNKTYICNDCGMNEAFDNMNPLLNPRK